MQTINWNQFFHEVISYPYFWPILIVIVALIITWNQIRKNQQIINLFKNETGKISVIQNALIDLIKKICAEVIPDSKPNVSLSIKKNKLNIKIKIKIHENQHIEKLTTILQKALQQMLKDTLGIENIDTINILITGFIKEQDQSLSSSSEKLENLKNS